MALLSSLQVVLVRAENPVNIGQAARAMRNFGVSRLALVNCGPHQAEEAYTTGWRGKHILDKAETYKSLDVVAKASSLVVGFTARSGRRRGEPRWLMDLVPQIIETMQSGNVLLVFGNEKNGLSNDELSQCHQIAMIPAESEYTSMNLSHAVSIALFSIYSRIFSDRKAPKNHERYFATPDEFEELMNDFREVLLALGYNESNRRGVLSSTLNHLSHYFKKAGLDLREFHLFKAFLARIQKKTIKQMPVKNIQ